MNLEDVDIDYVFRSKVSGYCKFNDEHKIRIDDLVFKPLYRENLLIVMSGYGCKKCLKQLKERVKFE